MRLFILALSRFSPAAKTGWLQSTARAAMLPWLAALAVLLTLAPTAAFAQSSQITISPSSLPNAFFNTAYSQQLTATGGTGAKTFAVTAGSLPTGLALNATTGVISGIPTTAGSFIFLITASDTAGGASSVGYTIVVLGPPTVTTPTVANVFAANATLGGTVTNDGGIGVATRGVVYSLTAVNANPQLGGNGVLATTAGSGTGTYTVNVAGLTQGSMYSFAAYATNQSGTGYSPVSTFTTGTVAIAPVTLPNSITGGIYNQTISATGGTGSYTFAVTSGTLPPGLTLNSNGTLSGTPTAEGSYIFTITATDSGGATRPQSYTVVVTPAVAIITLALPDHGLNLPGYSFVVQATGGTGNKSFAVIEGALPVGLALDGTTGLISGTPVLAGAFSFTIRATDTLGATASRSFTIAVGLPVNINTGEVADGTVNQTTFTRTIVAQGGTGFKNFAVSAGSLPPGVNLSSAGVLSGTPTTAGSYTYTITATDQLGASNTRSFTTVINPALEITPTSLPSAPLLVGYNQVINATGGTGGRSFSVTSGTLPAGLSLSPEGLLNGTPTTAGTFNFTVSVTDSAGATLAQAYSLVLGGPIAVLPVTLANPVINSPGYSANITATGGTGARTFAVSSGALPPGLTLASNGVLGGTATAAGTYTFAVTATDAASATGSRAYTVVVSPPLMVGQTISFAPLPNRLTSDGSFQLSGTTSSGLPISFNVSGPAILNGSVLTLTGAPGVVTVTASQPGNTGFTPAANVVQTFTVTAADRLVNLSSRVRIAPDATRSLITGFVVGGTQPKRVLLRAVGPALAGFGVTGALVNPRLQVFDSTNRMILENDDWSGAETAAAFTQVGAFTLSVGSRDAAVVTTLAPGSYTMQITAGTETGIALAEVYDASVNPSAEVQRLVNISTRGTVESGDGVLIGGFVISGAVPKRVLIRGVGPALGGFGVAGTLADPRLTVFRGTTVIAQNDDWSVPTPVTGQPVPATAAEISARAQSVGAFALTAGSRDAAVIVTLEPGAYTAQIAGAGTTTGVALVEIYEAP